MRMFEGVIREALKRLPSQATWESLEKAQQMLPGILRWQRSLEGTQFVCDRTMHAVRAESIHEGAGVLT